MDQINQQQLIAKLQTHYDGLVKLSNNAFQNSLRDLPPATQQMWMEKAADYHYMAVAFDISMSAVGVFLESKHIQHAAEADLARREHCTEIEHEPVNAY